MRKILLGVLILVFMLPVNAIAGNWHYQCTNYSCIAESGALKVYWTADSMQDVTRGKLTGVGGLPISIDDYRTVERRIQTLIRKNSRRAGETGQGENLFAPERRGVTVGQEEVQGERINIDYTLAFVEWLGNEKAYRYEDGIRKYLSAVEYILQSYKRGKITELIEMFLTHKNAAEIDNIDITAEINDENQNLILTKYLGITKILGITDIKKRYSLANELRYVIANDARLQSLAREITQELRNDLRALSILTQPNQTAEKLYRQGNKDLGFAKWLADNNRFNSAINKMQTQDKYIAAMYLIRNPSHITPADALTPNDIAFFTAERKNFEAIMESKKSKGEKKK